MKKESRLAFRRGLRDGVPIALGYFAVAFSLGIVARRAGVNALQGFLTSAVMNASAGEYAAFVCIAADAAYTEMAVMTLVANARYLLMSCALSQHLSPDTPLIFRLIIGYDLTDELFGIAISQPGYLNVWYYIGAMCAAMPCWSAGTVIGVLLGNLMPVWAVSGFSVMLFGMFIAIIVPMGKRDRVVLGCIIVSFLLGWLASVLPVLRELSEGTRILILTIVISAAAAVLFPQKEETIEGEAVEEEVRGV